MEEVSAQQVREDAASLLGTITIRLDAIRDDRGVGWALLCDIRNAGEEALMEQSCPGTGIEDVDDPGGW